MIVGVGLDIADTRRMNRLLTRFEDAVLEHVFTPRELGAAHRWSCPAQRLALSFGVKEACGKALGTGLAGVRWTDIEAADVSRGHVRPSLTGAAGARAGRLGIRSWSCRWRSLDDAASSRTTPLLVVAVAASDPAELREFDLTELAKPKGRWICQATSTSKPL